MNTPTSVFLSSITPILLLAAGCATTSAPFSAGDASPGQAYITHTKSGRLFVNEREIPAAALRKSDGSAALVYQGELLLSELDRLHKTTDLNEITYFREEGTTAFIPIDIAANLKQFSHEHGVKMNDTQFFQDGVSLGPIFIPRTH